MPKSNKRILLLVIICLASLSIFADSLMYPGFFRKHLLIDSRIIWGLACGLLLINKFYLKISLSERIRKINNYLVLPGLFVVILVATWGEFFVHTNFLYSLVHLNPFHLSFLLLLSWWLALLYPSKNKNMRKIIIFFGAAMVFMIAILIRSRGPLYFQKLVRGETSDDTLVEYIQFFCYLISSFAAGFTTYLLYKLKKPKNLIVLYLLGALALFFIAGEEISWGQRLFNIETPEAYLEQNTQRELNLHNHTSVFGYVYRAYVLLSFYGAFAWIIKTIIPKKIKKNLNDWLELFIPNWYFMGYFLVSFVMFYLHRIKNYMLEEFEEFNELILVFGILGFCIKNLFYYWQQHQLLKQKHD